jgi:putative transposase
MRSIEFVTGEIYHIYNRGTEKRSVFMDKYDYQKFLLIMREINSKTHRLDLRELMRENGKSCEGPTFAKTTDEQLVDVVAYCLNPNHYHFILRQKIDGGISKFMQRLGTSYTMQFNKRHSRSGALFQGKFKAIHIDSNEYLLYLSVYVNTNNFIHGYRDNKSWPYSSWHNYINGVCEGPTFAFTPLGLCEGWTFANYTCDKSIVMDQFGGSVKEYKKFVEMNSEHLKNKKKLGKYLLE